MIFSRQASIGSAGPVLFAVAALALPAAGQPTISNLGVLSGGTQSYSLAYAISDDGLVVTGTSSSAAGQRAIRWTEATGLQNLGTLQDYTLDSVGQAVSADGSVITGVSYATGRNLARAFRWTAATGMQGIGVLETGSASYGLGVSADGSVIVGGSYLAGFQGFSAMRWTAATGMQRLAAPPVGDGASAQAISADGQVVTGYDIIDGYLRAFRWTSVGGLVDLDVLPGADSAHALGITADGAQVVGYSGDQFFGTYNHAFRWDSDAGMEDLGVLDGSNYSLARDISADGSVIVGASDVVDEVVGYTQHAFLWTPALGMVDMNAYLPSVGVDLTGWILLEATGVSVDGSAIAGYGYYDGEYRAFLVRGSTSWPECPFGDPAIVTQPRDEIVAAAGSTSLHVGVTGVQPIRYQWRKDTTLINPDDNATAATATLSLSHVQPGDVGSYDCVVSNVCADVISAQATLTICPLPADFDCNGSVDISDLAVLLSNFGRSDHPPYSAGNVNSDDLVDLSDLAALLSQFGTTRP